MNVRTVLCADEGTILTDGTHYGTIIWLAEGANPDKYHAIPLEKYRSTLTAQEAIPCAIS